MSILAEQIQFLAAPDTGQGSDSSGTELGATKIRAIQEDNIARTYFRFFELGTTGLLSALEAAGVVPPLPENPNPFDAELQEEQHTQWWDIHPEQGEAFSRGIEVREKVHNLLYLGAGLRRLGWLYRTWSLPAESTDEKLVEYLKEQYDIAVHASLLIESRLEREGLLPVLEEEGIVPPPASNTTTLPDEKYFQRSNVLAYLHTGALLDLYLKKRSNIK